MKIKAVKLNFSYLLVILLVLTSSIKLNAQVVKSFTQRTAAATPTQVIYNIKGDFTMVGNTNLTLVNYSDTKNNSELMKFVDIDTDVNTFNSSSANLNFSTENGAIPSCSNIIYAGFYWTGRSSNNQYTFDVTKNILGTQSINNNYTINHGNSITNTNYSLAVTRLDPGGPPNHSPIYTFTGNGNTYVFNYTNNTGASRVTLSVNGAAATNIPVTVSVSGSIATATLTTPYTITDGTVTLTINQLIRNTSTNIKESDLQNDAKAYVNVSGTIATSTPVTKNFDKRKVSIKGPGATAYTTITAADTEIYYPTNGNQSEIFVGYKEVTDYVKTYGLGDYFVADIALLEGDGGNSGYTGGWGMIVVYGNTKMKSRAVTVFDGYAYANSSNTNKDIPISGFTTVLAGQVNMKLGVMATEGDSGISGDYLQVQQLNSAVYNNLTHPGNTTNNFFNSSIQTEGNSRNPNLINNTGIDISMFTIPNTGNTVIGNGQTSTNFKYGSSQDAYTIFGLAMSVESYVSEPRGFSGVSSINGVSNPTTPYTVLPGQAIGFNLDITNNGTEATNNTIIRVPVPVTSVFDSGSITYTKDPLLTTTNIPYFDATNNEIIWDIETLPIVAGNPDYVLANLKFNLIAETDCTILTNAGCVPEISLESGSITGVGAISTSSFNGSFFQGYDTSACALEISGAITVGLDASGTSCYDALAGNPKAASCGLEATSLEALGSGGTWTIVSGPSGGSFTNDKDPNSGFSSPNKGVYTLKWAWDNCASKYGTVEITLSDCDDLNFDGINDNINFSNNYGFNSGSFSLETWIKSNSLNPLNGTMQTIVSKRLGTSATDGYDLRLVNNRISFNWNNGNSITSLYTITQNRWYHIAVTFDAPTTTYKLYIDGIEVQTPVTTGSNPTINSSVNCVIGSMDEDQYTLPIENCFNGWMDELRFWNVALTTNQIRQMMNQEIKNDGSGNVQGAVVPLNINGLMWSDLDGYYQMNSAASDIVAGFILDKATSNVVNGKLRNINTPQPESAPIPYTTIRDGSWDDTTGATPWSYGDTVWDAPNNTGVDGFTIIDWNIVTTDHNVNTTRDVTVLGLKNNTNELSVNADNSLNISHYLKVDGVIDLDGESQLLQIEGSIIDENSTGYLERDQQGTASSYNYNYWASPVSPQGSSNNSTYTIADVLRDGTNSTPAEINFQAPYYAADNAAPSPIILSTYWMYRFNGPSDDYNSWVKVKETGALKTGEGFTLKGVDGTKSITDIQNYVFKGKPNNGTINLTLDSGKDCLIGNPYASAIDATEFINDNLKNTEGGTAATDVINGALYFWDHFATKTHLLRGYVGGYGTLNKIAGVKAVSNDARINANGAESTQRPGQYIPVTQGFFVVADEGGTITFKNSQRIFKKELAEVSVFLKSDKQKKETQKNNENGINIWLNFDLPSGYHRQLLIGESEGTTNSFDSGYDAPLIENNVDDAYWYFDDEKYVIQGVPLIDNTQEFLLGIKANITGLLRVNLDDLMYDYNNIPIYLKDNTTGELFDIKNGIFETVLEAGEYHDRFSIVFEDPTALSVDDGFELQNELINIYVNQEESMLTINKSNEVIINSVAVYNTLGQQIHSWNSDFDKDTILLPVKLTKGVYIAIVKTNNKQYSKKILFRN